jgi:hypothetical protein
MQTSNFKLSGTDPHAVAISRGVPKGFKGRRYLALAPATWALVKETDEAVFRETFMRQLEPLDAKAILKEVGEDAILLCWEKPGEFCHRRVVAEWLERELGISVPEQKPMLFDAAS